MKKPQLRFSRSILPGSSAAGMATVVRFLVHRHVRWAVVTQLHFLGLPFVHYTSLFGVSVQVGHRWWPGFWEASPGVQARPLSSVHFQLRAFIALKKEQPLLALLQLGSQLQK